MSATVDEALAEQTSNEPPSPPPAAEPDPFEQEKQLETELKESMPTQDELLGLEPDEAEPPDDDDDADEASPADDDKPDEPEPPDPAAEHPPVDDGEQWTYARYRRAKKQIGQEQEQLAMQRHQLEQAQAQLQPHLQAAQQLQQLAATDPAAAFQRFAQMTGRPSRELYEGVVQSYLRDGTPDEREKAVSPELRAMQQRVEAMENLQKEQQQAAQRLQHERARFQKASEVYAEGVNGTDLGDGKRTHYHYLAALPQDRLEDSIYSAVDMAEQLKAERGIVLSPQRICQVLDQQAQKDYDYQHSRHKKRLEASSGPDASGANGESQESSTDEGKPAGTAKGRRSERKPRQPRAPGNRAGAGTSPGARSRTKDEIDDELEQGLAEGLRQYAAEMMEGG